MVSADAKKGFDDLLGVSLIDSLKSDNYSEWDIKSEASDNIKEKELFMLTVSSYHFRAFLILHFTKNDKTIGYVSNALNVPPDKLDDIRYYDYLGELGNGLCGMYKRELGKYFPYLGMSTPNLMMGATLKHMSIWNYEHESHWSARSPDDLNFHGSIFVSSYGDVDFKYKATQLDANVETGELEFF